MAQSVASAIGKLKKLRGELADPAPFFLSQLDTAGALASEFHAAAAADSGKWIGIAQQTARDVLGHSIPDNSDPEEWALLSDYIASKVGILLAPGGHGVVIYLGSSQAEFDFGLSQTGGSGAAILATGLTLEQITDYVEAGLRGDPAGKPDITEHDLERTATRTAWNILVAFKKRSFAGVREEKIVEFIEQRSITAAEQFFPAIRAAWFEVFSVVAPRDFARWAEASAKRILT